MSHAIGKNNVPVGTDYYFDSINGSSSELVFEGTEAGLAGAAAFYGSSFLNQVSFTGSGQGAKRTLRVRRNDVPFAPGVQERTGFRLINNVAQKSVLEPPLPAGLASLTDAEIARVKKAVDENEVRENQSFPNFYQEKLYKLLLKGLQYREVYQPILQKTVIAGNNRRWLNSFANVGKIVGPFAVVNDIGLGNSAIRFALPFDISDDADFVFGWLKGAPDIGPGAGNLEILTQEYKYGLYSVHVHEAAS